MKTAVEFAHESFMEMESGFSFEYSMHQVNKQQTKRAMIDFAKMHVVEALRQASEKAEAYWRYDHQNHTNGDGAEVDKETILTAYSLDGIV